MHSSCILQFIQTIFILHEALVKLFNIVEMFNCKVTRKIYNVGKSFCTEIVTLRRH